MYNGMVIAKEEGRTWRIVSALFWYTIVVELLYIVLSLLGIALNNLTIILLSPLLFLIRAIHVRTPPFLSKYRVGVVGVVVIFGAMVSGIVFSFAFIPVFISPSCVPGFSCVDEAVFLRVVHGCLAGLFLGARDVYMRHGILRFPSLNIGRMSRFVDSMRAHITSAVSVPLLPIFVLVLHDSISSVCLDMVQVMYSSNVVISGSSSVYLHMFLDGAVLWFLTHTATSLLHVFLTCHMSSSPLSWIQQLSGTGYSKYMAFQSLYHTAHFHALGRKTVYSDESGSLWNDVMSACMSLCDSISLHYECRVAYYRAQEQSVGDTVSDGQVRDMITAENKAVLRAMTTQSKNETLPEPGMSLYYQQPVPTSVPLFPIHLLTMMDHWRVLAIFVLWSVCMGVLMSVGMEYGDWKVTLLLCTAWIGIGIWMEWSVGAFAAFDKKPACRWDEESSLEYPYEAIWAISGMSRLVVMSFDEDVLGVVQWGVEPVVESFRRLQSAISSLADLCTPHIVSGRQPVPRGVMTVAVELDAALLAIDEKFNM